MIATSLEKAEGFKRGEVYIWPFAAGQSYSKSNWIWMIMEYCDEHNIPYTYVSYDTEGKLRRYD